MDGRFVMFFEIFIVSPIHCIPRIKCSSSVFVVYGKNSTAIFKRSILFVCSSIVEGDSIFVRT